MIKRRQFIAGLGSAAAWPVVARAQHPAIPVIGFVHGGSAEALAHYVAAFRKGLGETGLSETGYLPNAGTSRTPPCGFVGVVNVT
jgi:putative ABC transport system substrate-binding protein